MARRAHAAAGLTFLEVVISLAILAATVATMMSGYGAMERMTLRDQDRLNAAEVAHQLILNYLYDPNSLPPDSQPIEQGKYRYRYALSEEVLIEDDRSGNISVRRAQSHATTTDNERLGAALVMITIRVYPDFGNQALSGEPLVSLSRIFNPYGILADEDDVLLRHVEKLLGRQLDLPGR